MPDQGLEDLQLAVLRKRVEEKRAAESTDRPDLNAKRFGDISPLESGISNLAQGLTGGYSDEIAGGLRAAVEAPFSDRKFSDLYREHQKEQEDYNKATSAANPWTSVGSEIVGSIASPISKIAAPIDGAGIASALGRAALGSGIVAGGKSENHPFESPDQMMAFAKDVGAGATTGAAVQGVLGTVGAVAERMSPEWLKQFARERAVKAATGQNKRMIKQASKLGQLDDIGDALLEGAPEIGVNAPLKFGSSVESIKNRAAEESNHAWDNGVTKVFNDIDAKTSNQSVDLQGVAQNILSHADSITPVPKNLPVIQNLKNEAEWLMQQPGKISLRSAQDLKNEYRFKYEDPRTHGLGLNGNNAIRKAYGDAIEKTISSLGSAADAKRFKLGMSQYGSMASAAGAADDRAVANISNRFISPSDYAAGIGTAVMGAAKGKEQVESGLYGLAASLAHKLLRERGSSMAAVTANKLSNLVKAHPRTLGAFQQAASSLPYQPYATQATELLNRKTGTEEGR